MLRANGCQEKIGCIFKRLPALPLRRIFFSSPVGQWSGGDIEMSVMGINQRGMLPLVTDVIGKTQLCSDMQMLHLCQRTW